MSTYEYKMIYADPGRTIDSFFNIGIIKYDEWGISASFDRYSREKEEASRQA